MSEFELWLIKNDFIPDTSSADGSLQNCYEKSFALSDLYWCFIAVEPNSKKCAVYIEYECGGYINSYSFDLGLNTDLDIDDTDYCKQQIIDEIDLIKENYKE